MGLVHENGLRAIMDENGYRYLDENRNVIWRALGR